MIKWKTIPNENGFFFLNGKLWNKNYDWVCIKSIMSCNLYVAARSKRENQTIKIEQIQFNIRWLMSIWFHICVYMVCRIVKWKLFIFFSSFYSWAEELNKMCPVFLLEFGWIEQWSYFELDKWAPLIMAIWHLPI